MKLPIFSGRRLSTKLVTLFLLISLVPLMITVFVVFTRARQTLEKDTVKHLLSTSVLKEAQLKRWIDASKRHLRALGRRPLIREIANTLVSYQTGDSEYQTAQKRIRDHHFAPTLEEEWSAFKLFLMGVNDGRILVSSN